METYQTDYRDPIRRRRIVVKPAVRIVMEDRLERYELVPKVRLLPAWERPCRGRENLRRNRDDRQRPTQGFHNAEGVH